MKVSEIITRLEAIKKLHGDINAVLSPVKEFDDDEEAPSRMVDFTVENLEDRHSGKRKNFLILG